MKIFICCNKHFYNKIPPIKEYLERERHKITLPNCYDNPFEEEEIKNRSLEEHIQFKRQMISLQNKKIQENDALLILNLEKNKQPGYIGGATFLEMYEAWKSNKKIFLYNSIPKNNLEDEIIGFNPTILNKDITKIENAMG